MSALWHISLLGSLRVQRGEQSITRFKSQKIGALLAYLAYHLRQAHPREVLIDMFWPESSPEAGRASLSTALSSLRHQLEPPGTPAGLVLRADRYSVSLNPAAVTTDVSEFESALKAAERAEVPTERAQLLMQAADLYRERLLPGYYEDWITAEQERLAGLYFDAVSALIPLLEAQGDLVTALRYARQAVSVDPLREEAHQQLMRLLAALGQPGAALRQFKELERLLEEELGEEPSAPLRALARQIEKQSGLTAPAPLLPVTPRLTPNAFPPSDQPATLTLLAADIEGSARFQEPIEPSLRATLDTFHATLRREAAAQHGQEMQAGSGSVRLFFANARSALACAVVCQQALSELPASEETGSLKARMALHTGEVGFQEGAYQGEAMQAVSRLLTAAHGGQILVSEATAGLVRHGLDEGVRLLDLGIYRLRGLPVPERLFQVEYPGLAAISFPAPQAEAGHPSHLPLQLTRFFGREEELAELTALLQPTSQRPTPDAPRLLTLTGPGGTGKTRLAIAAAERLVAAYQGAVWFVGLVDTSDPALIAPRLVQSLGLAGPSPRDPLEVAVEALSRQPSLLVLDNFERLVEGGAEIVQTLLARLPQLTCLVTSRQRLGLAVEREFPLAPLPTPNGGEALEQLSLYDSVQLFVDRAQAVMPHFQVTNANAAAVAELVHRLEGIPLAIELAAARAQVLTPAQMLSQLSDRFRFLTSRRRDLDERHRTLHAALDWSYRLLVPELQRFYARLSVFRRDTRRTFGPCADRRCSGSMPV